MYTFHSIYVNEDKNMLPHHLKYFNNIIQFVYELKLLS